MNDLQAQLEEVSKEKQELQEKVGSTDIGCRRVPRVKPGGLGSTQTPTAHPMGWPLAPWGVAEQSHGELSIGTGAARPAALLQGGVAGGQGGCG